MLLALKSCGKTEYEKLMKIYEESNRENSRRFFPECTEEEALKRTEAAFSEYLASEFFPEAGTVCYVLEADGKWVSALRLYALSLLPRSYYIEALETRTDERKKGYARTLLKGVISALSEGGAFVVRDNVDKNNFPSLAVHEKCGFSVERQWGFDPFGGGKDLDSYGLIYNSSARPLQ